MIQIILGGLMLSILHSLIPNHWISLVVLGKVEKWGRTETLRITAIAGLFYTLSTSIIGIFIGLLGYKLNAVFNIIGSVYGTIVLIILGLIYFNNGFRNNRTNNIKRKRRNNHKNLNVNKIEIRKKKPSLALVVSFCSAMLFSPCTEIQAYYSNAGIYGLTGIILLSFIYIFVTIVGLIILVDLGTKGVRMFNEKFLYLERHEHVITGLILILLGIESYFIKF